VKEGTIIKQVFGQDGILRGEDRLSSVAEHWLEQSHDTGCHSWIQNCRSNVREEDAELAEERIDQWCSQTSLWGIESVVQGVEDPC
jgi:hypothetical protein